MEGAQRAGGFIDRVSAAVRGWRHGAQDEATIHPDEDDATVHPDEDDATIHPDDEMYAFIRNIDPVAPVAHYLASGTGMVEAFTETLAAADRRLDGPLLEFACGHGRCTRHLVDQVDPTNITVSDIHPGAVDHVTHTYGVNGFVSVEDPGDLDHDARYRTIVVASLFSHLSLPLWAPWLHTLLGLLDDDGALVVSTNGPDTRGDEHTEVAEGFWYGTANETDGRLDGEVYGTAHVTEDYVRRTADEAGATVLAVAPRRLWTVQDLYVIA